MPKPRLSALAWWPWRSRARPAVPDAADFGTAFGLDMSLQPATAREAEVAPARRGRKAGSRATVAPLR